MKKNNQIDCYVEVAGYASDDEDEGVQGFYLIQVRLSREVDLSKLSPGDKSDIAEVVLDSFHNHQGIEVLDDFELSVYLPDGTEIDEDDDAEGSGLVKRTVHQGSVEASDLPFLPSSEEERFWDVVVPYFGLDTSFDYSSNESIIRQYLNDFDNQGEPLKAIDEASETLIAILDAAGSLDGVATQKAAFSLRLAVARALGDGARVEVAKASLAELMSEQSTGQEPRPRP